MSGVCLYRVQYNKLAVEGSELGSGLGYSVHKY